MRAKDPSALHFGANPLAKWVFVFMTALLVLSGIGIMIGDPSNPGGWILTCMGAALGLLGLYVFRQMGLVISAQAICLKGFGELKAPWSNVERCYFHDRQAGIVTRNPMTGKLAERLARERNWAPYGVPVYDAAARQWLAEYRYLPLRGFEYLLKTGTLQAEIQRHLPGAPGVETTAASSVPIPKPTPPQRGAPWVLASILSLLAPALLLLLLHRTGGLFLYLNLLFGGGSLIGAFYSGLTAAAHLRRHSYLIGILLVLLAPLQVLVAWAFFSGEFSRTSAKKGPHPTSTLSQPPSAR